MTFHPDCYLNLGTTACAASRPPKSAPLTSALGRSHPLRPPKAHNLKCAVKFTPRAPQIRRNGSPKSAKSAHPLAMRPAASQIATDLR